jgi:hypothetical protein
MGRTSTQVNSARAVFRLAFVGMWIVTFFNAELLMHGVVKRILFPAFTAVLLCCVCFAGFASAGLSSSAAQELAGEILGADAGDANSLSQPIEVGSDDYWVFFYSIYSPKRMLVAISDSKNEVVTNEDKLYRVGSTVYSYAVIEEFLKPKGWGFSTLEPVFSSSSGVIAEAKQRLTDFSTQTRDLYPALSTDFSKLESSLEKLDDSVATAQITAFDGVGAEAAFASDYSANTLQSVFRQYNASLRSVESVSEAFDEYQAELSGFSLRLYKANVTPTDAKDINSNLAALRDVGLKELRDKFVSQRPQLEFSRLAAGNDKWVNDSIASMLYRKNRSEAIALLGALEPQVQSLFDNEAALAACGISQESLARVRKDWGDARYFSSRETASGFARALEKALLVQEQVTQMKRAYDSCTAQPTSTTRTQSQSFDYSLVVGGLVLLLLVLVAYSYWRKKQEESEQFGGQQ